MIKKSLGYITYWFILMQIRRGDLTEWNKLAWLTLYDTFTEPEWIAEALWKAAFGAERTA